MALNIPPNSTQADIRAKFAATRNCTLAIIVLSVEPLLTRRPGRSHRCLEEVSRPISEEDVGEQTGAPT